MEQRFKRVNVTILEDQYEALTERGLNVSGLIRDLLGDYLAENVVTIQVSEETREVYDLVVSNTGSTDADVETHLRKALAALLEQKITEMKDLHEKLRRETDE